ncbi:MAG: hypothetical protein GXO25_04305 [Euryarchaeota archaeon]|nr:hypothetical protein [Euryarchaeota archaeon]
MVSPEDVVHRLNQELGKMDSNLFEVVQIYENFFGEYVVHLRITRMIKATYSSLKKIAEISGAQDILIEKCYDDNLQEIKLTLKK